MKKTTSTLALLTGLFTLQHLPVSAQSYSVSQKDIHNGFVVEKIWLKDYAMPDIDISNIDYTKNVALPQNTQLSAPGQFRKIIGMERKRPFVAVQVPVYTKDAAGAVDQVSGFTLSVTEKPQPATANPAAKTTDVTSSVLATGKWFKIGVTKTGFYKIDFNLLTSMGVNTATVSAANMRVYGNGGHMLPEANSAARSSDLTENAILVSDGGDNTFNSGDYAIFYANGVMGWDKDSVNQRFTHLSNLYSDTAYYFITFDKGPGLRVAQQSAVQGGNKNVTDFNYYAVHDSDGTNPVGIGKLWYGEQFNAQLSNTTQTFSFDLGATVSSVYCNVSYAGTSNVSGNSIVVAVNGNTVGSGSLSSTSIDDVMSIISVAGQANCNSQTANVRIAFNPLDASGIGYLNYIELNARRPLSMSGEQLSFRDWQSVGAGNIANYNLQGANSNTRVWDITYPQVPVLMSGTLSGSTYTFTQEASMLHEFAAFSSANVFIPKFIGTVDNQDIHASPQVNCIIVTNKDFLDQAKQLADYHTSHDGMSVLVATNEQVYNEFSSGAQDISAIRDLARMFYKRAGTDSTKIPKYLVLFGGASYDYKNRVANNSNFVPVFESANSFSDIYGFSTDDFYGFLDDNENIEDISQLNTLDIGVGRLPARSVDDAKSLVNKIVNYTAPATLGPWRISSTFVADNNDIAGEHMNDAEDMASCVTNSSFGLYNEHKVYIDAIPTISTPAGGRCPNANAFINDQVFKGTFLINYNGHGNPQVWAGERILTQDDFNNWNNPKMLPFMITATCDFGQFDNPKFVSAAEQLAIRSGGGVITVLTTTAAVYARYNHEINEQYLTAQFTRNEDKSWNTFGDACRIGKNITYINSVFSDELANFRKFALLGDPALSPDFPNYSVILDSVTDGATLEKADTIKALGAYVMNGSVRDHHGNVLTDFNGIISISFYDKPRNVTTISGTNKIFQVQDNIVYKGKATVTNGRFSFTFITPKDINYYYGTGKLSTYAQNGVTDAAGADTSVTIGGFSDNPINNDVPPVVKVFINDSLFLNGGITGSNTSLFVELNSVTGINVSGNNLGHDLIAVLDGNVEQPYILNDYYETAPNTYKLGYISFPITGLADGRHTITVHAWDVNDNTGEGSVDFMVVDGKVVDIQELMNYPNPFSNSTHFVFEHNHPSEELNVKINIYNTSGSLVKTLNQDYMPTGSRSADITWDGTDENGARLPSGLYIYRLNITIADGTNKGFQSSAYQKLVIVR